MYIEKNTDSVVENSYSESAFTEKTSFKKPEAKCAVNSFNEWDPLEEVIVGRLEGASFPAWKKINENTVPPGEWDELEKAAGGGGTHYPATMVGAAQKCLDGFIQILKSEGVIVKRPDVVDYAKPFSSPEWGVSTGFCAANPRDPFIVFGNEILETPMADRSRYFEAFAYRRLFKEYFKNGAKLSAAPRPQLRDSLYDPNYTFPKEGEPLRLMLTEEEPVFDAADCVRCGKDVFIQKSQVTNDFGIEWLARHLGSDYNVHVIEHRNPEAIHIDTTFMPLAPGKLLVSPDYIDVTKIPAMFKTWDVIVAPEPVPTINDPLKVISKWGCINVLMLDEKRVIVEKRQTPLMKVLKSYGFEPIPCDFEAYFPFMGSFHCATLDVRRNGGLQSYF
jgi:glycine amidinotransferase